MAQTVKSLLRLSMAMRNLGMLTNYTISKRFIQISTSCPDKETLLSPRPHLSSDQAHDVSKVQVIEHALRACKLRSQVFSIVQNNHKRMTAIDAITALDTLTRVQRDKDSMDKTMRLDKEFMTLCEIVKKNIRNLQLSDVITVLKSFVYFEIPMTSIIAQMILQMLRQSIGDLELHQISFIYFLLQKCERTPLSDALIMALPIVYENNVTTQLDRENIIAMRNALIFLSKKSKNCRVFGIIMHAIRNYKQPIEASVAVSILWSLCSLRVVPDGIQETVNYMQNILSENITSIRKTEVLSLVDMLATEILPNPFFYHEGFFDSCASVVITEDWGFMDALFILERLTNIRHTQILLLDYIAGKCFEEPKLLKSCSFNNLVALIHACAVADYKPIFWDIIQDSIMNYKKLNEYEGGFQLSKLAISLLSLDCYCPRLLEKIFKRFNETTYVDMRGLENSRLIMLYQAVKTLYPQYDGPLPDNSFIEKIRPCKTKKSSFYPLLTALECALGGRRYILTNVTSKLGHFIDHVLVMRKGGFPMAINNETDPEINEHRPTSLEELKPIPDSQVILVVSVPTNGYSINTQRMTGTWSIVLKTLEALTGYTVISIPQNMWNNLSEMEKIPYIMQAIRIKCDETSVSANS